MTINNLTDLENAANEMKELQSQIDELNAKVEEIKNSMKEYLGDKEEMITESWIVHFTNVVSNRFNQSKFKEDHLELFNTYLTPSSSRRFQVTPNTGRVDG